MRRSSTKVLRSVEDTSTNKVTTVAKGLQRFDGNDRHAYRKWRACVSAHLDRLVPNIRSSTCF